ncbi:MAG TPA: carboxypeptidase regulatory-like domain-containing protein [Pyrinomonadaceae bacterium]|nr:carboxypeptidase regulatory-like domain-containing protein [Pyrinomonadaceae bacterium]
MGRFCFLTTIILLTSVLVFSQPSSGRSSLTGVVQDQTGAAIVGARVELRTANASQQGAVTDQSGNFQFKAIRLGKYQLLISSPGFESATTDVVVGAQPRALAPVVLAIASLRQETTVTSTPAQITTEPNDNKDTIALSEQSLSNLPVFDQDYIGAMSRFLDPGSIGTGGVTLIVNGMEVNNLGVSPSAIKEIKINQDPYSAEFARPGRGRIEVTTKPGSPEYHGTFNFIFRDAHLNARDPFAVIRPPEQRRIYEGVFTGPIKHSKKTSFLISVSRKEEDLQSVVFAQGPTGSVRQNVAAPSRTLQVAAQINHSLSDTNSFSVRYSFLGERVNNQGVGGTVLPEAGVNSHNMEQEINYSQQTVFSPKLVNNFRLLLGYERQTNVSLTHVPRIVVPDSFTGGGGQADYLRTEYHAQLMEMLSYSSGKHLIKGGLNIPDLSRRGFDNNLNSLGTFYFSGVADYLLHRPYSFTQQQGNGHIVFLEKQIGVFVQDQYHPRKTLMFSIGVRYDWQNYFHDRNNFAPRFSFAYGPGKTQKTVFRGGAGVFYDRSGARPIQDILLFNGSRLRQYVLLNPGYPDPLSSGASLTAQPVGITRLQPNINIPYTVQYSFGVERQLKKTTSLAVTYLGSRGFDQFRSRDINAPLPPTYASRPDSSIGLFRQIESAGRRAGDSLEVTLRGNVTRFFNGMAQYRLATSHDDTSGITYFPPNAYDLSGEWARSDFDRRHRFELLGTINPGKLFNLGVSVSLYSGLPYTLTTGIDAFHTGTANARPAGVPRNSLNGPGYADLDFRWSRDFILIKSKKKEGGVKSTLAVDAFNVLNSVNYAGFVGNLSSPFFGRAIAAQPPRRLQLSFRLKF